MLKATDVFKPNGIPEATYFDRSEHRLEQLLRDACAIDSFMVSVAGPSKTGKTVLITKTVDPENSIPLSGASIHESLDVWRYVLSWMDVPTDLTRTSTKGSSVGADATVEGKLKVPLIADAGASGTLSGRRDRSDAEQTTLQSGYFTQVIKEIGGSEFVIFIKRPPRRRLRVESVLAALGQRKSSPCPLPQNVRPHQATRL